jgi:hypothetical protein
MVAYKATHGHLKITGNAGPAALKLREWLRRQRKERDKMRASRVKMLNSVGFEWNLDADTVWHRRLAMFTAFVEDFGLTCIPEKTSALSNWIRRQRLCKREGRLPENRMDRLNEIGFPWVAVSVCDRSKPSFFPEFAQANPPTNSENDDFLDQIWNARYKALVEHKIRVGHCLVPDGVDCSLQKWCAKQQLLHSTGALILSRAKKLEALGFDFHTDSAQLNSETWESMYKQLESFKEQNGHCVVPMQTCQHRSLNNWMKEQRQVARTMNPSRWAKLNHLGFCWTADDEEVEMPIASQETSQTGQGSDDKSGNRPTELEDQELKVSPLPDRSRLQRTSRRQSARTDATCLRHVLMTDKTLVDKAVTEPVSNKGFDGFNEPVGVEFDVEESTVTAYEDSSERLAHDAQLDAVTGDGAASIEAKCTALEKTVEAYRRRLSVVEKELKVASCKLRRKEMECRKMGVLISQMKSAQFATGSVGDKVMSRLREKMNQKGVFSS